MKKIYPHCWTRMIYLIALIGLIALSICGMVAYPISRPYNELLLLVDNVFVVILIYCMFYIVVILFAGFLTIVLIKEFQKKIVFFDDFVFIHSDFSLGELIQKIQFEAKIPYESIKNITLVISNRDSHNQPRRNWFTPMPYIMCECRKEYHLICVFYYSKKQVIDIIDTIKAHMEMINNQVKIPSGQEIYDEFLLSQKRKK